MPDPGTQQPSQRRPGQNRSILDPTDGGATSDRARLAAPAPALLLVAASFALLQLALLDRGRFLEWDEAVYISRASDRFSPIAWSAHRAEGVAWLIEPVLALSSSFSLMRLWLILTSSVAIAAGFATWLRPAGYGAPLGMAFFCGYWLTLFYGSEASPNLYVAACAVAAVGCLARTKCAKSQGAIAGIVLAIATAVLFRPSDGFVLATCVVGGALLLHDRRAAISIGALTFFGVAVGFLPWVVEAIANFGGPVERWREASATVASGPRFQVADHLRLVDGPLIGPDAGSGFPLVMTLVLLAPGALALVGGALFSVRRVWLPLGFAIVLPIPYLFYVGALAPRFLLPAIALAAVGGGIAGMALGSRSRAGAIIVASVLALSVGISAVQAHRTDTAQTALRSEAEIIGQMARTLTDGKSCYVLTQYGYPQIAIASNCVGQRLAVLSAGCQVAALSQGSDPVVVALVGSLPPELSDATVGPQVDGPNRWVVARVDPKRARCGDGDQ